MPRKKIQTEIVGAEAPTLPDIENIADDIDVLVDKRKKLGDELKAKRAELNELMHGAKREVHKYQNEAGKTRVVRVRNRGPMVVIESERKKTEPAE